LISVKNNTDLNKLRECGRIVKLVHKELKSLIEVGITTLELNDKAQSIIIEEGAEAGFLNYREFPFTICVSIDNEILHGLPSKRKLEEGQLVSIDVGVLKNGFYGDACFSTGVKKISGSKEKLLKASYKCLNKATQVIKNNTPITTIGRIINNTARTEGFKTIKEYCGHGIGRRLHEKPNILNYEGRSNCILSTGMCICIEPILSKCDKILVKDQAVYTLDNSPAVHVEQQLIITEEGCEVIC